MTLHRDDWWILLISIILAVLLPWWLIVLLPLLPLLLTGEAPRGRGGAGRRPALVMDVMELARQPIEDRLILSEGTAPR